MHGDLGTTRQRLSCRFGSTTRKWGVVRVASTGGDSYRSARQSTRYSVEEIAFDAGLLSSGENAISLRHALGQSLRAR